MTTEKGLATFPPIKLQTCPPIKGVNAEAP